MRHTYFEVLRSPNIRVLMNEDVELTEAHIVVQEDELSQSVIETELHRLETVLKLYFRKKIQIGALLKIEIWDRF